MQTSFRNKEMSKIQEIDGNSQYCWRKPSYLLNELRIFKGFFRKDVPYDNTESTESHK